MGSVLKRLARLRSKAIGALICVAVGSIAYGPSFSPTLDLPREPGASFHRELVTLALLADSSLQTKPAARSFHRDLFGILSAAPPSLSAEVVRTLETLPGIALAPSPSFTPNARAPPRAG